MLDDLDVAQSLRRIAVALEEMNQRLYRVIQPAVTDRDFDFKQWILSLSPRATKLIIDCGFNSFSAVSRERMEASAFYGPKTVSEILESLGRLSIGKNAQDD